MTEAELQEIEQQDLDVWPHYERSEVSVGEVRALIAEVRRLRNGPTDAMLDALGPLLTKREREWRANPAGGACCCVGPHPVCACIRRRITEEYRAMMNGPLCADS